jgi:hypothetical protein
MAKIVDPDFLYRNLNVFFDATGKTITVVEASGLTADGVTLQCLYSFSKEQWKSQSDLVKYPFPWIAITAEQFELVNSWNFGTTHSKELIRDGGWALKDSGGTSQEEYMNLTTLGTFNATGDTAYYLQSSATTSTPTVYSDVVNQAIKIYGDTSHGNIDYRTFFKIYLREQGKSYGYYDLMLSQNLTTLTYKKYALPLSNAVDLKITHADSIISGSTPYTNMSITWTSGTTRSIGGVPYTFSVIINGASGTAEQIYEFVQWSLRQPGDIDAGVASRTGKTAEELLTFVGDALKTNFTSDGGVYIDNFLAVDTNRLSFTDDTNVIRTFPYVAAGYLNFNDNLRNDSAAYYWVFFTNANGNAFNTPNAIIIKDNSLVDVAGYVSGRTQVAFDYDYQNNNQGGRTPNTDAPFTAVSIGLSTGQYVLTTGSILRSTANSINFVAALERNYSNP